MATTEDLAEALSAYGVNPDGIDDDHLDRQLTEASRAAGELGVLVRGP